MEVVDRDEIAALKRLKEGDGTDIYLCGGGAIAGFLLEHDLVDRLVLKVNPIVFGHGIRLFGGSSTKVELALLGATSYANGVSLLRVRREARERRVGVARGDLCAARFHCGAIVGGR